MARGRTRSLRPLPHWPFPHSSCQRHALNLRCHAGQMVQAQYFTPGLYSAEQAPQPVYDMPAVPVQMAPMPQPMMAVQAKPQVAQARARFCSSLPGLPSPVLSAPVTCLVAHCRRRAECRPGIQRGTISTSGEMQRSGTRGSRRRKARRRRWIQRRLGECRQWFRCRKMPRTHIFRALASRQGGGPTRRSMCQRLNTLRK